jgi:lipopolysaccharide transport system permease protein
MIYMLNPMAGVVEGFRWALLGTAPPPLHLLMLSAVGVLLLFLSGAMYFRRVETQLADWI